MAALLLTIALLIPLLAVLATAYRLSIITNPQRSKPLRHGRRNPNEPTHLLIVLGSGGHTAEMLAMLTRAVTEGSPKQRLVWKDFTHRTWVVGSGDSISATRAKDFEHMAVPLTTQEDLMEGNIKRATDIGPGTYDVAVVPRAREIHQPLYTSPMSSLACAKACWELLTKHATETIEGHMPRPGKIDFPDVILCNGPATATILVFTSVLLRFFDVKGCSTRGKMRTVYVESWARVKKLSLSGRLLRFVVDRFLVQWPQLERAAGGRAEYLGVLV
jgi:beta-1,4-N-acetylglucosaminyltransferase